MITPDYLKVLCDYHYWATDRILDTAARLEPADLDTTLLAGLGSLRQILVHALSAERIWRSRLGGVSPAAMLDPAELPTLAAIRARWAEEEAAVRALIAGRDAAAPPLVISGCSDHRRRCADESWLVNAESIRPCRDTRSLSLGGVSASHSRRDPSVIDPQASRPVGGQIGRGMVKRRDAEAEDLLLGSHV